MTSTNFSDHGEISRNIESISLCNYPGDNRGEGTNIAHRMASVLYVLSPQ
jgi:hypothetical protein